MPFRLFAAAALLALLHALDDAFLLPGPGVPLTHHALAAGIATVSTALAIWKFASLRPGVRAAIAFSFGALAMVNGGRHVHHIVTEGATANDVTGALAFAAGLVLLGLAAWIPFSHRGEGSWPARLLVPPAGLLFVVARLAPIGMGIVDILAAAGGRRAAERRLRDRPLHRLRRQPARGLVPPVAQRRVGAQDARADRGPPGAGGRAG